MDKNFSREEKEKFVGDLVLKFAHIAWHDGHNQACRECDEFTSTGWKEWKQSITEQPKTDEPKYVYVIWNHTDGVPAGMYEFDTEQGALEQVEKLRDGFRKQGYYRDNNWNKIAPEDIQYEVLKKLADEDESE